NYLFSVMDTPTYKKIVKTLIEKTEGYQETVMTIADRLRNEGLKKGLKRGVKRGLVKGREEARQEEQEKAKQRTYTQVLTSLSLGLDIDIISKITGLSHSEIQDMS
ncbi:transposase, partial [Providencia sp. wls1922]|nr:transposase [Providencia sp. wls1922]